ncbi:hypothetical protein OHA77_36865 [Streptosporangium sp. NBC_01639]|uniref:hypothetical protein n=1 Tax=Streptosporangium sp. NBC_01639 TaxID=2975948 RepID=UPI003863C523|nr:hypothetical protein OHA77_36865 [Streptosporangium sp. NBC_01639]
MDPMQIAAVAVVLTAYVLYRQMKTRVATGYGLRLLALFMIAIGLLSGGLVDPRHLALSLALLAVEVACAVAFGFLRASTVRIWRDEAGVLWSKGTGRTLLGWLASLLTRVALLGAGYALGLVSVPTALLVFMGLTVGVQSFSVARRARALPSSPAVLAHG